MGRVAISPAPFFTPAKQRAERVRRSREAEGRLLPYSPVSYLTDTGFTSPLKPPIIHP